MQVALGSKNETICVERGGPPKAPVFGGANPASVPVHIRDQVTYTTAHKISAVVHDLHIVLGDKVA